MVGGSDQHGVLATAELVPPSLLKAGKGKANLSMSTNQLAERFGAVSMTLEMPFKDYDGLPCAVQNWSPERSAQLGRDCLGALLEWLEERADR